MKLKLGAATNALSFVVTTLAVVALIAAPKAGKAIPAFARKYNVACVKCHTMAPRLTPFGYAFERAGFRFKTTDDKPKSLAEVASALTEFQARNTNPAGDTGFDMGETLIMLATPLGTNLSTRVMYEFNPSGLSETWGQYNSGVAKNFWTIKFGQFPVLGGFRQTETQTITATDPLIFGAAGPFGGSDTTVGAPPAVSTPGNFNTGGLERGVEAAYTYHGLTARANWFNGVDDQGSGTGSLTGRKGNDYGVSAEYLYDKIGGNVSGYYYHGRRSLTANFGYDDNFYRMGFMAGHTWYLIPGKAFIPDLSVELLGGMMWGRDRINAVGDTAKSVGSMIELDVYNRNRTGIEMRYDALRATDNPASDIGNTTEAFTMGVTHLANDYVRFGLELRNQRRPNANSVIANVKLYY